MHRITITVRDGEGGDPLAVVEAAPNEMDAHAQLGVEAWPPCKCPIHLNPETGEGTRLNLSGLRLVRPPEAC